MLCFQVFGKVADEMVAFRIDVGAALMGCSPVVKAWWGQGSEGAPEWMDLMVVAVFIYSDGGPCGQSRFFS